MINRLENTIDASDFGCWACSANLEDPIQNVAQRSFPLLDHIFSERNKNSTHIIAYGHCNSDIEATWIHAVCEECFEKTIKMTLRGAAPARCGICRERLSDINPNLLEEFTIDSTTKVGIRKNVALSLEILRRRGPLSYQQRALNLHQSLVVSGMISGSVLGVPAVMFGFLAGRPTFTLLGCSFFGYSFGYGLGARAMGIDAGLPGVVPGFDGPRLAIGFCNRIVAGERRAIIIVFVIPAVAIFTGLKIVELRESEGMPTNVGSMLSGVMGMMFVGMVISAIAKKIDDARESA